MIIVRKGLKTIENRLRDGYGQGHGATYKPFFKTREFSSTGFCYRIRNPYTGRTMEFMSTGEVMAAYELLWNQSVQDIREQ